MATSLLYFTRRDGWQTLAIFLLMLGAIASVSAQKSQVIDSLQGEFQAASSDSARIYWLQRLTWHLISNDSQRAQGYNAEARQLAGTLGDSLALARCDHYEGLIHRFLGNYAASVAALERALRFYESRCMDLASTGPLFNLGVVYGLMGDYEKATDYLYRELAVNEALSLTRSIGNTLNSLGSVSRKMGKHQDALAHYQRARAILQDSGNLTELANVLSNTGGVYFELGQMDLANGYFRQALTLDEAQEDRWGMAYNLHRLGTLQEQLGRPDSAAYYLDQALALRRELGQKMELSETMIATGSVWYATGKPAQGIALIEEALKIAEDIQAFETQTTGHKSLAIFFRKEKNLDRAYQHLEAYAQLRDSVLNREMLRITTEMSARYETAVKDQQLAENQVEIATTRAKVQRQHMLIQVGLAGLLVLGAFLALLLWMLNERKKHHEQSLNHLRQSQELSALKNVMTGEEKERKRIARELHDGLSSLLAAIKLQFNAVQQSSETLQSHRKFNEALTALDDASREIRRIAHNMMPEMLIKYGLIEALKEFVNGLNHSADRHFEFSYFGGQERLPDYIELVIYRAAQELLNNVIRHSQASEVLLQLNQHEESVILTAEDNGAGFDPGMLKDVEGLGLNNLRSRVHYLQGQLSIESVPGSGSSFYIEIPLPASTPST
ncbi:MAG: sensor histidine kinase [Bacteroidia bacterium]|nr:sensor histidine kinase [Bacteroidia bacterium]